MFNRYYFVAKWKLKIKDVCGCKIAAASVAVKCGFIAQCKAY
jgi:hypothetical protein